MKLLKQLSCFGVRPNRIPFKSSVDKFGCCIQSYDIVPSSCSGLVGAWVHSLAPISVFLENLYDEGKQAQNREVMQWCPGSTREMLPKPTHDILKAGMPQIIYF